MPNGLMLQVFDSEEYQEPVMTGGYKTVKRAKPRAWRQKLNGPARAIGKDTAHQIINGVGLTHGVDAEMFALWLEQNRDNEFVTLGHVFAQGRASDAIAAAAERRKDKTGLEPIDRDDLPPEFKRKVETAVV
ncbi:MAG TPA: hypothetical protein VGF65_11365 [Mycobacterium sp.]